MGIRDRIKKAKINLFFNQPFFASLILKLHITYEGLVSTACTNGSFIDFNPSFVEGLKQKELIGLLVHEALHVGLGHHLRRGSRDPQEWNKACDYAINQIILDAGLSLPKDGLWDKKYKGMSSEQIFELLQQEKQNSSEGSSGNEESGENDRSGGGSSGKGKLPENWGIVWDGDYSNESERQLLEQDLKRIMVEAAAIARKQGNLPANINRLVDILLQPQIDWREALAQYLINKVDGDYTWMIPNKRYVNMGIFLPSIEKVNTLNEIILLVDTSGSIQEKELNEFATEMQDILSTFQTGFKVVYIDSQVNGVDEVEPDEEMKLNPKGGGGTDFKPGFKWIEENNLTPDFVLYFTDGYCSSFPIEPDYPVLWVINSELEFQPPFGDIINFKN